MFVKDSGGMPKSPRFGMYYDNFTAMLGVEDLIQFAIALRPNPSSPVFPSTASL